MRRLSLVAAGRNTPAGPLSTVDERRARARH
jgi:hypothetical protein